MIRYQFDTSAGDISTDEENILIGFSTQEKKGTLMYVRSDSQPPEYISIEINNNGWFSVMFIFAVNSKKVCLFCLFVASVRKYLFLQFLLLFC